MMDIGSLRTNTSEGHETITYNFQTHYNPPFSFKGFPSTGLLVQCATTIPSSESKNICDKFEAFWCKVAEMERMS